MGHATRSGTLQSRPGKVHSGNFFLNFQQKITGWAVCPLGPLSSQWTAMWWTFSVYIWPFPISPNKLHLLIYETNTKPSKPCTLLSGRDLETKQYLKMCHDGRHPRGKFAALSETPRSVVNLKLYLEMTQLKRQKCLKSCEKIQKLGLGTWVF